MSNVQGKSPPRRSEGKPELKGSGKPGVAVGVEPAQASKLIAEADKALAALRAQLQEITLQKQRLQFGSGQVREQAAGELTKALRKRTRSLGSANGHGAPLATGGAEPRRASMSAASPLELDAPGHVSLPGTPAQTPNQQQRSLSRSSSMESIPEQDFSQSALPDSPRAAHGRSLLGSPDNSSRVDSVLGHAGGADADSPDADLSPESPGVAASGALDDDAEAFPKILSIDGVHYTVVSELTGDAPLTISASREPDKLPEGLAPTKVAPGGRPLFTVSLARWIELAG